MMPHQDGVHVAEQIPWTLALENKDIEKAIIGRSTSEHLEGSSVESPISQQNEGSTPYHSIVALNGNLRRLLTCNLREGEEITQRAECFFGFPGGAADDLGIKTDSGQLDEASSTLLRLTDRKVEHPDLTQTDDFPGFFQGVQGNPKLNGEDIHRADWEDPQRDARITCRENAVHHLIDGSIPSGSDDGGEPLLVFNRVAGDLLRISGRGAQTNLGATSQIT